MKQVRGYVCSADIHSNGNFNIQILYGRSHAGRVLYGNLEGNGFLVFGDEEEARKTASLVKEFSFVKSVRPAFLEMRIGKTPEEIVELERENSLAVIAINSDTKLKLNYLVGPIIEGRPSWGEMPCALMRNTNYTPFTEFWKAEYAAKEINRQADCGIQIASFKLEASK